MAVSVSLDAPDPDEAILRYLIDLPGAFLPHSGATLFHHLLGTYRVLKAWECEEDVCVAGLFHSVYGTPAYQGQPLPATHRGELSSVIGARAEELVHQFSRMNWPHIFSSGDDILRTLPSSLLTLSAANIVEQLGWLAVNNLEDLSTRESLEGFKLLIPYLPSAAAQCLALVLQRTGLEV